MALWSLGLAALGVALSRWGVAALRRHRPAPPPRTAWVVGLPALLLAWLVPFVDLLGEAGSAGAPPRLAFMAASAAAILGVLASDQLLTREERRSQRPDVSWLLGVLALLPGWLAALLIVAWLSG